VQFSGIQQSILSFDVFMCYREGASSLNYLIETPFQTRIVELLIDNVHVCVQRLLLSVDLCCQLLFLFLKRLPTKRNIEVGKLQCRYTDVQCNWFKGIGSVVILIAEP
jgi:hypothetical protein